jgi:hypothetical protein
MTGGSFAMFKMLAILSFALATAVSQTANATLLFASAEVWPSGRSAQWVSIALLPMVTLNAITRPYGCSSQPLTITKKPW